jgi:hypothetical protein
MKKLLAVVLVLSIAAVAAFHFAKARAHPSAVVGLWVDREPRELADEMRFYYFGKEGHGLYRYGQAGYNQTHSFDWRVRGDTLELKFRKSGQLATTRFQLGEEDGRRTITLKDDPRGPGGVRYRYVPSRLDLAGPLALPDVDHLVAAPTDGAQGAVVGRMWIALQRYATGGMGFSMYQFSEHGTSSGWRRGWHHLGDFDDWTTETLEYRDDAGALSLRFPLRGGDATTPLELSRERDERVLRLSRDPRNFYHRSRFVDAGPSF